MGLQKEYPYTVRRKDCNPGRMWNDLVTPWGEFITKEFVKKRCACTKSATCLAIVDLFNQTKFQEWVALLGLMNINA